MLQRSRSWLAAVLLALTGCARPPDAHVPDFARRPYEPFERAAAVAIALREWRSFGMPVADEPAEADPAAPGPERAPGLWQRVGEYWWLGLDADDPEHAWTGKHDAPGRGFPPERDADFAW